MIDFKNRAAYIVQPYVWISIFILCCNDHLLKLEFHNWWTGKISDVAGVFVLPFILAFFFNGKALRCIILTSIFFIFWKSSYSDGFIHWYNQFSIISITRVVDYSDTIALFVLPASYYLIKKITINKSFSSYARPLSVFTLVCTSFVFIATSPPRYYRYNPSSGNIYLEGSKKVSLSRDQFLNQLKENGVVAYQDTALYSLNLFQRFPAEINYIKLIEADSIRYATEIQDTVSSYYAYKDQIKFFKRTSDAQNHYRIDQIIIGQDTIKELQFSINEIDMDKIVVTLHGATIEPKLKQADLRKKYRRMLKRYLRKRILQ